MRFTLGYPTSMAVVMPLLLLLLPLLLPGALPAQGEPAQGPTPLVMVVPIDRTIDSSTVVLTRRALGEAKDRGVSHVILRIDTPGGLLTAMTEVKKIVRAMNDFGITPLAFVEEHAFSAGALLAMACSEIYMRPGADIGAATPIEVTPIGARDIQDRDVRTKQISALRGMARSVLELRGNVPERTLLIAEAIVDPDMEMFEVSYRDASGVDTNELVDKARLETLQKQPGVKFAGEPRELRTPLTLTAEEAERFGIARGIVDSLQALVEDELALSMSQVLHLKPTWADNLANWLNDMKPVLFVLGFILLLIEFKTPGFALPGILGIIMLALAFWASSVSGLTHWGEILLFFLGIGLIGIEIFVMPGTVIFGLLGFVCVVTGLILSQQDFVVPDTELESQVFVQNLLNFTLMMIVVMVGTIAFYRVMHRIPFFRRAIQPAPQVALATGAATAFEGGVDARSQLVGQIGVAKTLCRPAGIMEIGSERYDVVTEGDFVKPGTKVKVIFVEGNRIVVETVRDDSSASGQVSIPVLFLLMFIGLALLIAEVFFVSGGILGVLAGVSLVTSVFLAFSHQGMGWGITMLSVAAVGAPLCIYYALKWLPHTPFGKKMYLGGPDPKQVSGSGEDPTIQGLLHKTGVAVSDLRPSGFATIEGRRVDVVTRGELLDKNTGVRVIEVEGNRVVVSQDNEQPTS
ncbi:MAG: NfeD family protein [Planctomycetota bacterium]|jgi:membrane-bound serine protease (ClpP class)